MGLLEVQGDRISDHLSVHLNYLPRATETWPMTCSSKGEGYGLSLSCVTVSLQLLRVPTPFYGRLSNLGNELSWTKMHFKHSDRRQDVSSASMKQRDDTTPDCVLWLPFSRMVSYLSRSSAMKPEKVSKPEKTKTSVSLGKVYVATSWLSSYSIFYIDGWQMNYFILKVISVNDTFIFQKLHLFFSDLDVLEFSLSKCSAVNTPLSKVKGKRHCHRMMVLIFSKRKKKKKRKHDSVICSSLLSNSEETARVWLNEHMMAAYLKHTLSKGREMSN